MTQEETKECIKVMQAFANGKKIEFYDGSTWGQAYLPEWDWFRIKYRIAPDQEEPKEKHYRPYTMEEFVEDMHKHDGFIKSIRQDEFVYGYSIYCINKHDVYLNEDLIANYEQLFKSFVWSDDGTVVGKELL